MQVQFDHATTEADDIMTFYFKPERKLDYTAGQFIELTLPHHKPDNRGEKRWFTLSSAPSEPLLSITTKFAPHHGSSFKKALHHLKPGSVVHMSDAMGDFVLPKLLQTPLIFVAGGIGITPFHSILTWVASSKEQRQITLLYGVNQEDEIIFTETFDKANQHATIVVKDPSEAWGGEHGELSAELILGLEKPTDNTLIYLSGPEPMIEALTHSLHKAGVATSQLVTDFFPGYETI
jgi:ferredoxin-NADP reductase